MQSQLSTQSTKKWTTICKAKELNPNAGTCAKFNDQQVAIFFCKRSDTVFAVSNYDPIGQANVLSRGLMGSLEGASYVASPLYKQHFDLVTGQCLESPEHALKTYAVRIENEQIQLQEAS